MSSSKLIIGNKNYSSWSLRGWLATRQAGIDFEEVLVDLGEPNFKKALRSHSKSAKVPVLIDGDREIWDTLAIIEYLFELRPEAGLWPLDQAARAKARSIAAEMHSSFGALRGSMPMNIRKSLPGLGREPGVQEDIDRITEIWRDCRSAAADNGDFLFGAWSAADAMYAPVVSRFKTFAVELDPLAQTYADAVLMSPLYREWETEALKETWIVEMDEIDGTTRP